MFLLNLFRKKTTVTVNLHLYPEGRVEEIEVSDLRSDKDYILLALLIYARMLRILGNNYLAYTGNACLIFLELEQNEGRIMGKEFEQIETHFSDWIDSFVEIPALSIVMTKKKIASLHVGIIHSRSLENYIYLAFNYAWNNINPSNRRQLLDSFIQLSRIQLSNQLSTFDAILIPNNIVEKLILSK